MYETQQNNYSQNNLNQNNVYSVQIQSKVTGYTLKPNDVRFLASTIIKSRTALIPTHPWE